MDKGPWIIAAVAVLGASLSTWLSDPPTPVFDSATSPRSEPRGLPRLHPIQTPPATKDPGRAVPADVLRSAHLAVAPWAPGLSLQQTKMQGSWRQRRALIKDLSNNDLRAYAIGDLLPHGSLLIGISTAAIELMVADAELVRLETDGSISSVFDFREADAGRPLTRASPIAEEFRAAVLEAVVALSDPDPEYAQEAVDALIEAGEPTVELLIDNVKDAEPVVSAVFNFGGLPAKTGKPLHRGAMVMAILERITEQHFGDPLTASATELERQAIQWRRWADR